MSPRVSLIGPMTGLEEAAMDDSPSLDSLLVIKGKGETVRASRKWIRMRRAKKVSSKPSTFQLLGPWRMVLLTSSFYLFRSLELLRNSISIFKS